MCAFVANVIFAAAAAAFVALKSNWTVWQIILSRTWNFTRFHHLLCVLNLLPIFLSAQNARGFCSFEWIKEEKRERIENRLSRCSLYIFWHENRISCIAFYSRGSINVNAHIASAEAARIEFVRKWNSIDYFAMRLHVVIATLHWVCSCV